MATRDGLRLAAAGGGTGDAAESGYELAEGYGADDACGFYVWIALASAASAGVGFAWLPTGQMIATGSAAGRGDGEPTGGGEGAPRVLPPACVSTAIELREMLWQVQPTKAAWLALIEALFSGCSRLVALPVHAGHNGSLLLEVRSWDPDHLANEPALVRIDSAKATRAAAERLDFVSELIGAESIHCVRGPKFANLAGTLLSPAEALIAPGCLGAVVVEVTGVAPPPPPPQAAAGGGTDADAPLALLAPLSTHLAAELAPTDALVAAPAADADGVVMAVLEDLWSAGGALPSLALHRPQRAVAPASGGGRTSLLALALQSTLGLLRVAFLPDDKVCSQSQPSALNPES